MFTSYDEIFSQRGHAYHEAMQQFPDARNEEFQHMQRLLARAPSNVVIDAPSGGGYLHRYLRELRPTRVIAVDPTESFASQIAAAPNLEKLVCPLESINLPSGIADAIASIAGLHHVSDLDAVFSEFHRLLRDGGRLCILEVPAGSKTDRFLNGFVDRHCSMGHEGRFIDAPFRAALLRAGFKIVEDALCPMTWHFRSASEMTRFASLLFGLDKITPEDILSGIAEHLGIQITSTTCTMNWALQGMVAVRQCHEYRIDS